MLKSKRHFSTDLDPNGPTPGRVLEKGHPDAKFTLVAEGGIVQDDIAKKFNLKEGADFEAYDPAKEAAAQEAKNRATYEDNEAQGGALKVAKSPEPVAPVAPTAVDLAPTVTPKTK